MVKNETINRAIDYIFAHIEEKITIEDVAEYCNYSKFHFSRLFKEEMGKACIPLLKETGSSAVRQKSSWSRGSRLQRLGWSSDILPPIMRRHSGSL